MPFSSPWLSGGIACRVRSGHRLLVLFLPILGSASGALLAPGSCRRIGRCRYCGQMLPLLPSAGFPSLPFRSSSKFVRVLISLPARSEGLCTARQRLARHRRALLWKSIVFLFHWLFSSFGLLGGSSAFRSSAMSFRSGAIFFSTSSPTISPTILLVSC